MGAGYLVSVDSYMNLQLASTEEFVDGAFTGNLGEVLIRCNNVMYLRGVPEDEDAAEDDEWSFSVTPRLMYDMRWWTGLFPWAQEGVFCFRFYFSTFVFTFSTYTPFTEWPSFCCWARYNSHCWWLYCYEVHGELYAFRLESNVVIMRLWSQVIWCFFSLRFINLKF